MPISLESLNDILESTLPSLDRGNYTNLITDVGEFDILPDLLAKKRMKMIGGKYYERKMAIDKDGNAHTTALFDKDRTTVGDHLITFRVPIRFVKTSMAFDCREFDANQPPEEIVDIIEERKVGMYTDLAELLDKMFYTMNDPEDEQAIFSLFYWIVGSNSDEPGFKGMNPTGFGDVANVDSSQERLSRWRNWAGTFKNVNDDDLISKMRKAARKTKFKSPISVRDETVADKLRDRFKIITSSEILEDIEKIGRKQNDNLGHELDRYAGEMAFKRNRFYTPDFFDENNLQELLMIDEASFGLIVGRGGDLEESQPMPSTDSHNVKVVHVDLSVNTVCKNRRHQARLTRK